MSQIESSSQRRCPPSPPRVRGRLVAALFAAALVLAAARPVAAASAAAAAQAPRKLVILGFDGADAKLTERWMEEGKLPHLAELRRQGTFAPLLSTIPSQTPVSWSTFSAGLNPGRHGIFDFLKRDPLTYRPSFAAFDQKDEPFLWGRGNGWVVGTIAGVAVCLLALLVATIVRRVLARQAAGAMTGDVDEVDEMGSCVRRQGWRGGAAITAGVALLCGIGVGVGAGIAADRLLPKQRPVAFNRQHG